MVNRKNPTDVYKQQKAVNRADPDFVFGEVFFKSSVSNFDLRQIPLTEQERVNYTHSIFRAIKCVAQNKYPDLRKIFEDLTRQTSGHSFKKRVPESKWFEIRGKLNQLKEIADNFDPFKPRKDKSHILPRKLFCIASSFFADKTMVGNYALLYDYDKNLQEDFFLDAFKTDAEYLFTKLKPYVARTHIYLMMYEYIVSFAEMGIDMSGDFLDLVQRFPATMHTQFAIDWCEQVQFEHLFGKTRRGITVNDEKLKGLSRALISVPDDKREGGSRTPPTLEDGTALTDYRVILEIVSKVMANTPETLRSPKKSIFDSLWKDLFAYHAEDELLKIKQSLKDEGITTLPATFKTLRKRNARRLKELGHKGDPRNPEFRLEHLKLLVDGLESSPLAMLRSRKAAYLKTSQLWRSEEFRFPPRIGGFDAGLDKVERRTFQSTDDLNVTE